MATPALQPRLEPLRESVRHWADEQAAIESQLEAELEESFAALEAFQRSLEEWQQSLVAQREQLQADQTALAAERETLTGHDSQLASELSELKTLVDLLELEKEDLAEQLKENNSGSNELMQQKEEARRREIALQAELESERADWLVQQHEMNEELNRLRERSANQSPAITDIDEPATSELVASHAATKVATKVDPVLGSVLEQFGKLRQQQAKRKDRHPR